MSDLHDDESDGRDLWRRFAPAAVPASVSGEDANLLAALLEGRLGAAERAALEVRLAASADLSEAWRALRDLDAPPSAPPPPALVRRARALVAAPARPGARGRGVFVWRDRHPLVGGLVEWAAAAAALVAVAVIGFDLGSESARAVAGAPAAMETALATPMEPAGVVEVFGGGLDFEGDRP